MKIKKQINKFLNLNKETKIIENKLDNQINNDNKYNKNEDKKLLDKKIKMEEKGDNKNN